MSIRRRKLHLVEWVLSAVCACFMAVFMVDRNIQQKNERERELRTPFQSATLMPTSSVVAEMDLNGISFFVGGVNVQ